MLLFDFQKSSHYFCITKKKGLQMLPPFAVAIAKGHWVDIVALVPTIKVSQDWPAVIRQSLRYAGKKLKPEAATMDFTNPAVLHALSEHIRSWFQELKSAGDDDDEQHESVTQNMAVWVRHLDAAASVLRTMSMDMEPHIEYFHAAHGGPLRRYGIVFLIRALALTMSIRDASKLRHVLRRAVELLFPSAVGNYFKAILGDKSFQVPSTAVLSQMKFVLDAAIMLRQRAFLKGCIQQHCGFDMGAPSQKKKAQ